MAHASFHRNAQTWLDADPVTIGERGVSTRCHDLPETGDQVAQPGVIQIDQDSVCALELLEKCDSDWPVLFDHAVGAPGNERHVTPSSFAAPLASRAR